MEGSEEDPDFDLLLALADEVEAEAEAHPSGGDSYISGSVSQGSERKTVQQQGQSVKRTASENAAESCGDTKKPRSDREVQPGFQVLSSRVTGTALFANRNTRKCDQYLSDGIETFSGLSITKTVFPLIVLRERFAELSFLKLPQIQVRRGSGSEDGPWATVAVLADKSRPKDSSGGSMYSIWEVSDLEGTSVKVMLFGEAHQQHFKEAPGTLFALFNGKVRAEDGRFSVSVEAPEQLVKLGTSKDFGFCKARRKDGQNCTMAINKSKCSYCDYHVQGELRRMSTVRATLRANNLKTAFRGSSAAKRPGAKQGHVSKLSHHRLQAHTMEQLRQVAQAHPHTSSLGKKYILKMAEAPEADAHADQQPARGAAAFNPDNRISARITSVTATDDQPRLPRSNERKLPAAAQSRSIARPGTVSTASLAQMAKQAVKVEAQREYGGPVRELPDPATDAMKDRPLSFPGSSSIRPATEPQIAEIGRSKQGTGGSSAQPASGGRCHQRQQKQGAGQPNNSRPHHAIAPAQEGELVTLEEEEIDWLAGIKTSDSAQVKRVTEGKGQSRIALPGQKPDQSSKPASRQVRDARPLDGRNARGSAHSRGECVYDEEEGGMVMLADDDDGVGLHPRPAAMLPLGAFKNPARAIPQCLSTSVMREARDTEQARRDAELRDRAAVIFRDATSAGIRVAKASTEGPPGSKPPGGGAEQPSISTLRQALESSSVPAGAPVRRPPLVPRVEQGRAASAADSMPGGSFYGPSTPNLARSKLPPGRQNCNIATGFAATFGAVLEDLPVRAVGTRYANLVEDEEADRLERMMTSYQQKDEVAQRAEAITKLMVSAFKCCSCGTLTEKRRPQCTTHDVQTVRVTKRWWTCARCGAHSSTLGALLPQTRCRKCQDPGKEFKAASMVRAKKAALGDRVTASRDQLTSTVEEAFNQNKAG